MIGHQYFNQMKTPNQTTTQRVFFGNLTSEKYHHKMGTPEMTRNYPRVKNKPNNIKISSKRTMLNVGWVFVGIIYFWENQRYTQA